MHKQAAANHQLPNICGLPNHLNSFHRGMLTQKLNTKFDADSLFYSLSHFECYSQTVHVLTQQHLLPPLTSTVKSSLFTHVHSTPLSLAARLHRYRRILSRYINNGWTFSGQTSIYLRSICISLVCVCVCVCEWYLLISFVLFSTGFLVFLFLF